MNITQEATEMYEMCTAMQKYEEEIAQRAIDDFAELLRTLRESGREADFDRVIEDHGYRERLLKEYSNIDPNGTTWTELQEQLYTADEIEQSRKRVAAVEPDAAAGDTKVASDTRKNA